MGDEVVPGKEGRGMGVFGPVAILGGAILVATFLIMWNFRGRGFGELMVWRRPTPRPEEGTPGRPGEAR